MSHEIKDTGHSLEEVMASADYQDKKDREAAEKAVRRKALRRKIVRLSLFLIVIGGMAAAYVYRDQVSEIIGRETESAEQASGTGGKEESAAERVNRNLEAANRQAEQRDAILNDIHAKGMRD